MHGSVIMGDTSTWGYIDTLKLFLIVIEKWRGNTYIETTNINSL